MTNRYYSRGILITALLTCGVAGGQLLAQGNSIDSTIAQFMQEQNIPGFAACVVTKDSILWSGVYGKADIKDDIPMSLDGIMNIGSISKTFTATAAMQLWEDGLIDLEADVNDYLDFKVRNPDHPELPITIFQILTHTSSIRDGDAYGESYACGDPVLSLYDWIYGNLSPEGTLYNDGDSFGAWAPGETRQYSNVAFGLLGLIVERVSGTPFNLYCKEKIFQPVGMAHTGWFLHEIDTSKYIRPYGYITDENRSSMMASRRLFMDESELETEGYAEICLYSFPNYPDGLVRTSIRDLSLYLRALLNDGSGWNGRILKGETLKKMLTLQLEDNHSQGLCWYSAEMTADTGERTFWGHTGGDPGITTYLFFDPVDRVGVITFQNRASGGTEEVVKELFRALNQKR